jgi:hypothetical protein
MRAAFALGLAAVLASLAALADSPDACTIVTLAEVNSIAGGAATKIQVAKSGNPSECQFVGDHQAAVLVITIRQVQYAAENELQGDRETLEKIYKAHAKWIDGVGEHAFWMAATHQLEFRKGKTLVNVRFAREKNRNELDSAQIARLVEARLK